MLVFGVDIPLVEVVLTVSIILFILLIETAIVVSLAVKQMNKAKELLEAMDTLVRTAVKKDEVKKEDVRKPGKV